MINKNNLNVKNINKRAWRNGSVSDSRSAGWGFKSLCPQTFFYKKSYNKGIRLIKKYVFKLYKLMKETLKEISSEDEQDA